MREKVIVMGGCGSSGTTLLTHLISKNKHIYSGPEFNFFNHRELYDFPLLQKKFNQMFAGKSPHYGYIDVGAFMTYRDEYGINYDLVREWMEGSGNSEAFINTVARHMNLKFNTDYFLEKSPTNVYSFDILSKEYKKFLLIHVIRDGRDVVTSLMKRGFNLFGAGSRWLFDTLAGLRASASENYLEVRYEDLVKRPEGEIRRIFDKLDVPFDSQVLHREEHTPGQYEEDWKKRKEIQAWKQKPSDPISVSSVGRYRNELCAEELNLLSRIVLTDRGRSYLDSDVISFKGLIEQLGYERAHSNGDRLEDRPERQLSRLASFKLQAEDHYRRFKRLSYKNTLPMPVRLTKLL